MLITDIGVWNKNSMKCIVCQSSALIDFGSFKGKQYWKCDHCEAKILNQRHFLSPEEEKAHYLNHQNIISDEAYRRFLNKVKDPLQHLLSPGQVGLDYGCGSGPALADMFRSNGFKIDLYDPFFFPDKTVFGKQYDFITCTETVEHFYRPFEEFRVIGKLLKPNGKLGLMTCFSTSDEEFENWHYRRDPTHVVFYKERTFQVISEQNNWQFEVPAKDVVIVTKL